MSGGEAGPENTGEFELPDSEVISHFKQSVIRVKPSVDRTWQHIIPSSFTPYSPDILFADAINRDSELLESRRYTSTKDPEDHMVFFRVGALLVENMDNLAEFECDKANFEDVLDFVVRKSIFREYIYLLFEEFGRDSSSHRSDSHGDEAISRYLEPLQDQLMNPDKLIASAREHDEYAMSIGELHDSMLGFAPMVEVLGTSKRLSERNHVIELSLQRLTAGLAYASIDFEGSVDDLSEANQGKIKFQSSELVYDIKHAFRERLMGEHTNLNVEYDQLTATQKRLSEAVGIITQSIESDEGFPDELQKTHPSALHASKFPSELFANSYPVEYEAVKVIFSNSNH